LCEGLSTFIAVVHRKVSVYTWLNTNINIPSEEKVMTFICGDLKMEKTTKSYTGLLRSVKGK